jgi:hypothetical protein
LDLVVTKAQTTENLQVLLRVHKHQLMKSYLLMCEAFNLYNLKTLLSFKEAKALVGINDTRPEWTKIWFFNIVDDCSKRAVAFKNK